MIYNLINYSLEQKLYNYTLKQIDGNLLEIIFNDNKFLIYHSNIQGPVNKRPPAERRIQLNPKLKETLHSYMGEDYRIILLGFDKTTNTFSFWNYGYDINIRSTQSLPTRIQTLNKAKAVGFDFHYYKNKNLADRATTEHSFAINAFLFPLILENYQLIFNKDFPEIFRKKIQSWNNRFRKDELVLCLDLYNRKYPINKNALEVEEISNYCKKRSDLMGFVPREFYYQELSAKNFRNINGISKKIENIATADPTKKLSRKGLIPDPHAKKILIEEYITKSNVIDHKKLYENAKQIKNRIISDKIDVLIGATPIEQFENNVQNIFNEEHPNVLLNFDINRSYKDPNFDEKNYSDPIDAFNARDRATKLHEFVVKSLAEICIEKGLKVLDSVHIDFYTEYKNRGKLFEIKTFNKTNLKKQIRYAIIQLKEYYFKYAKFNKQILKDTDLFILLNDSPQEFIKIEEIEFLKDQNINICWFKNNKIQTFKDNQSKINWLL